VAAVETAQVMRENGGEKKKVEASMMKWKSYLLHNATEGRFQLIIVNLAKCTKHVQKTTVMRCKKQLVYSTGQTIVLKKPVSLQSLTQSDSA
jgi:hypothetical protein